MSTCPQCQNEVAPDAKFCSNCGKAFTSAAQAAYDKQRQTAKTVLLVLGAFILIAVIATAADSPSSSSTEFQRPRAVPPDMSRYATLAGTIDLDTAEAVPDSTLGLMISARDKIADSAVSRALQTEYSRRRRISEWRISRWVDEMSGRQVVSASTRAMAGINLWLDDHTLHLTVRCRPGDVDVYLWTKSSGNIEYGHVDEARMRLRFDEGTARTEWWSESTDGENYFAPAPRRLIDQLRRAELLRIEFTPFNEDPQVSAFQVSGFRHVLADSLRGCR